MVLSTLTTTEPEVGPVTTIGIINEVGSLDNTLIVTGMPITVPVVSSTGSGHDSGLTLNRLSPERTVLPWLLVAVAVIVKSPSVEEVQAYSNVLVQVKLSVETNTPVYVTGTPLFVILKESEEISPEPNGSITVERIY